MATIKFLGAAQEVTGSCYLLESPAIGRVLLDCGMHQGGDAVERMSEEQFAFDPKHLDAVILSHAHIDHSGLLPKLVHHGFKGPIYCTEATAELLDIMLNDAFSLYQHDVEKHNLRLARKGHKPIKMEFTRSDVHKVVKRCNTQTFGKAFAFNANTVITFHDAGHILGSAIVELTIREKQETKTLVFSGDLGNSHSVLMNEPVRLKQADLVLMEGTYGNREHRSLEDTIEQLRIILDEAWERGGNVLIPAFAVGRTQELLFHLGRLYHTGQLQPDWQIYLDSPMAISVTRLYDRWRKLLDYQGYKPLSSGDQSLLDKFLPTLHLSIEAEESIAINKIKSGMIVIAGSGMCTGGRIRHHFKQRIWNKNNCVLFTGFQARGTLGRALVDGARHIKLFGEDYVVKARIETLGGFSAHAGQQGLMGWVSHFESDPRIMLVHGEPESLDTLSHTLWTEKHIKADIAAPGQCIAF